MRCTEMSSYGHRNDTTASGRRITSYPNVRPLVKTGLRCDV